MANIVASDVTVAVLNRRRIEARNHNRVRLSFGNGVLTYPDGGIPLSKGKFGCPTIIESMVVVDKGVSGYQFTYDQSTEKLVLTGRHHHDLFLNNAEVADSATARVNAGANLLGANTGADVTVAGISGVTGHGGILPANVEGNTQPAAFAIAAQVIEVEVIGW